MKSKVFSILGALSAACVLSLPAMAEAKVYTFEVHVTSRTENNVQADIDQLFTTSIDVGDVGAGLYSDFQFVGIDINSNGSRTDGFTRIVTPFETELLGITNITLPGMERTFSAEDASFGLGGDYFLRSQSVRFIEETEINDSYFEDLGNDDYKSGFFNISYSANIGADFEIDPPTGPPPLYTAATIDDLIASMGTFSFRQSAEAYRFNQSSIGGTYIAEEIFQNVTYEGTARLIADSTGGPATGTAPEPASWALMISGFGLAGAALRRHRGLAS